MPLHTKLRPIILALFIFCALSCDKNVELQPDTVKRIVTFSLKKPGGISFSVGDVAIVIDSANIVVTVPAGTDRSVVIPEITIQPHNDNRRILAPA